jgi:ribosomal protein S18 acetylase RimI-like enzyme
MIPVDQTVPPKSQSAPSLRIRLATEADIPHLVPMINAAFTVETFLEGTRTDHQRFSALMLKGEVLLAEDASGRLIGSIYTELRLPRGYLGMLAIDPAHQRTGHGRTLMAAGEDYLRGMDCQAVDICVIEWRTELPPIYRKLGYCETAIEDFQPSQKLKSGVPPCRVIVMSKPL